MRALIAFSRERSAAGSNLLIGGEIASSPKALRKDTSSELPSLHTTVTGYPQQRKLQGIEFNVLEALTVNHAHFSFVGQFQNEEITWDATLLTLARHHAEQPHSSQAVHRSPFLEVGVQTISGRALRIVLDVAQIDEPTILRSIIMIRQYKRLHVGRHEFGVPRVFPPS